MGRPRKPPARKKIKDKMAFLIDNLLDSALNSTVVIEDLVTKTSIARSALDYLKMTRDEEEEKENFFEMEKLSSPMGNDIESIREEAQDVD